MYVHHVDNVLECLDLATGRPIWSRDLGAEFDVPTDFFGVVASPLVTEEYVIQNVGSPDGPSVVAFDKHTGRAVWGAGEEWGPSCASPVLAQLGGRARLFVLAGGDSRPPTGGLWILDPEGGEVAFRYPFRSRTYESVTGASPVVAGDRVFVTASYNTGTAALGLEPDGGFVELWKNRRLGMQFSNPVFEAGYLYAIDGTSGRAGAAVCIDPATGEELARTNLDWDETFLDGEQEKTLSFSVGEGSLLAVDGDFLCLGDFGHLLWLELGPEGAEVQARATLFRAAEAWTPPVVRGGLLYVRQNNRGRFDDTPRRLLCYDLRRPAPEPK